MEEDNHRKCVGVGVGVGVGGRHEDANRELAGGIDDYIEGENAIDRLHRIGSGLEVEKGEKATIDCTVGASGEVADD